nr:hypothetical protein [uncultured Selenomonas sp.]
MEVVRTIVQGCRRVFAFCIGVGIMLLLVGLAFLYGLLIDGAIKTATLAVAAYAVYAMLFL